VGKDISQKVNIMVITKLYPEKDNCYQHYCSPGGKDFYADNSTGFRHTHQNIVDLEGL
jgi:hypothetical protein